MYSICVVATGQHVGKTTISLGLVGYLRERGLRVRFSKPVGQQYLKRKEGKIDKDSVLMQSVFGLEGGLLDMSPVTVPRGFVEDYIFDPDIEPLRRRILEAFERLSQDCDVLVVEGTGHAGVGSCFDLSNAEVASMLGAHALLVAEGGIGSTIDEVALNISLFKAKGVEVLGVVANKVFPDKREKIERALGRGLANQGLKLLGVVPFESELTFPRIGQIASGLKAEILCGEARLDTRVENTIIAAMGPVNVLRHIRPRSLMITPGDRIDNMLVAVLSGRDKPHAQGRVEGLILTGGLAPHDAVLDLMRKSEMPVVLCGADTYTVSSQVQRMVFKIQPDDADKIALAQKLVRDYVDTEAILAPLA